MTTTPSFGHRHDIGITRREWLQVGYAGFLGLGLPSFFTAKAGADEAKRRSTSKKAKSLIVIFLTGAPSQIDTFDLKPDSPVGIRGEFKPIATKVPGMQVCEHLPRIARLAEHFALVHRWPTRRTTTSSPRTTF